MSAPPSRFRLAFVALAVATAAIALTACGDLGDAGSGDARRGELTTGTTSASSGSRPQLPQPTSGQVQIEGELTGTLTDRVTAAFRANAAKNGLAIDVAATSQDADAAFGSLCDGGIDLVDSSRRISEEELQSCGDNGLEVVDFQVAFDAAVVVTRNERDVGADCVNFDQLRAMFAAGTPVSAWNQVNPTFFPIRLSTAGPEQDSSDFRFFGQRVLGVLDPTLADFRSDYVPRERANQIKNEVVGRKNDPGGGKPPGTAAIIGFSFYELYEDKLRPLEIDGQLGDRCVFPSEETIASELYPLERTLRIYATQRSLNRQEVQQYLRFYLRRSEGIANRNELIPVSETVRRQEIKRISDPLAYGETTTGGVSEPDPSGTVSTTSSTTATATSSTTSSEPSSTTTPGEPSAGGVETTTSSSTSASSGSAPPTTTSGSAASP